MNKFIFYCILLLGLPVALFSQNINGRFSSSIYTFERYDTTDVTNTYVRSYQMLNLNVNEGRYSLRTNLNFESDLSKKVDYDPRVRFYSLYLEARSLFDIATVKLGRQPLFNSVAGGIFDGASVDLKYTDFKLSGYYGGNVPAYQKLELTDKWKDDYIFGGRFSTTILPDFQVALSYVNKNFRPYDRYLYSYDVNLNPIKTLIESNSNQYKFASADVSYEMKHYFTVDTHYDYDFNYNKTSKVEVSGRYNQIENLGIDVYYNYREPRVRYNSIFSVFDFGNTQEYEIGADYRILDMFTVIGKFGNVKYQDDNSQRVTLGVNTNFGGINYRKTMGYAGELDAISLYSSYSFLEGFITPSVALTYTSYKLEKDGEKNNLASILAGFNVRPWRVLSFDLQGQYMDNKIYKNDFRMLFKINYWFNTNL